MNRNGRGAVVESSVPGRIRLRIPHEQRRMDTISRIESVLWNIEGVADILTNPNTGSMLIRHDPDVIESDRLLDLAKAAHIVSEVADVVGDIEQMPWPQISKSAARAISNFRKFDNTLYRLTGGTVDGKMLIILFLLGAGVTRAFLSNRRMPTPWYSLLWYSYSAFMQWHRPSVDIKTSV